MDVDWGNSSGDLGVILIYFFFYHSIIVSYYYNADPLPFCFQKGDENKVAALPSNSVNRH